MAAADRRYADFATFVPGEPGAFTAEECDRIIAYGRAGGWEEGTISDDRVLHPETRQALCHPLAWGPETQWLADRITGAVLGANERWWGLDVDGFPTESQLLLYRPGGHYTIHTDLGSAGTATRKLSVSVQLSDPSTYEGGMLWLGVGNGVNVATKERGAVVVFPSWLPHQVTPTVSGERYALVCWFRGPPFR